jgi:hypothetical protein
MASNNTPPANQPEPVPEQAPEQGQPLGLQTVAYTSDDFAVYVDASERYKVPKLTLQELVGQGIITPDAAASIRNSAPRDPA